MKRDRFSPSFSSCCTADGNYDPLGWAGSPAAGLTGHHSYTRRRSALRRSAPQGPGDLSATRVRQERDPSQLDESGNSNFARQAL